MNTFLRAGTALCIAATAFLAVPALAAPFLFEGGNATTQFTFTGEADDLGGGLYRLVSTTGGTLTDETNTSWAILGTSAMGGADQLFLVGSQFLDNSAVDIFGIAFSTAHGDVNVYSAPGGSGEFKFLNTSWTPGYSYNPTTQKSGFAAALSITSIVPVPEPASWLFMIAGLGVVGAFMRRRHVNVSFA